MNTQRRKQKQQAALAAMQEVSDRRLILILGPAQSGKTELLRQWVARQWASRQYGAVAWITLKEDDNQPDQFARSLAGALQTSEAIPASMPDGDFPKSIDLESRLIDLLNEVAGSPRMVFLVLDGYQHITNPVVHAAVALALEYPSSNLRVIIASRDPPPLQLPRLRIRRQLLEIHL